MNFICLNRGLWRNNLHLHKLRLWQRWSQLTLHFYIILLCFTVHFSFSNYLPLKDSWNYLVHHFQYACFLYDFSGHTVNLIQKSKGRDDFFNFVLSVCVYIFFLSYNSRLNLLAEDGRIHVFLKRCFSSQNQQKIKTHVYIHLLLTETAWRKPITFSLWKQY